MLGAQNLKLLLLGIVLICLSACANSPFSSNSDRPVLARVRGTPIYVDEFRREYLRQQIGEPANTPIARDQNTQKRTLLDELINRRLLLYEAERTNVIVGTDEVDAAFTRSQSGWERNEFDSYLKQKDLTPSEFKNYLREDLLIKKYFHNNVFARIAVTDREIEESIKAQPDIFIEPEKVRALHLVLRTEEEATRVLREIKNGLSFENAAIKYSLLPNSKNGGDLGLVPKGIMPPLFDEICFNLPLTKISPVIASDTGFYIFKVIEKRPQQVRDLATVKELVEKQIRYEKERLAETAKLAELRKAAAITIAEEQLARVK
ncbi:MAG: SurA N-terminal domain-containing protein [Deltaproteobacteria bacterium]|nr:SurA N-terminal domain-containing protein [Deltaproteobacteria bacterium]